MANISEAIKRPFTDFKKLVIGIILSIIPIINLFSLGYVLECSKSANKKRFELPEWKNWSEKFVSGFFLIVVLFVYSIPLIIYGIWIFGIMILRSLFSYSIPVTSVNSIPLISWIILLILTLYVTPAAILSFVFNKNLSESFKLRKVFGKAFTKKYLNAWIKAATIYLVMGVVLGGIAYFSQNQLAGMISNGITGFVGGISFYTVLGEEW